MKISRLQIVIIGAVVAVVVVLGIYFGLTKGQQERYEAKKNFRDQRQTIANQKGSAERDLKEAEKKVAAAQADWGVYLRRFMPDIDVSNTYTAWQQLIDEQTRKLGPKMDRFLRADKAVRILQAGFSLPAAPDDPNQALSEFFVFSPGSVQVAGTFKNVLHNAERWNQFDRLVLVNGLQLSGNSPNLVAQYGVTVYEFTRGDRAKAVNIPQASGGAGGGGFGGMMGGRGGGGPTMGAPMGAGGSMGSSGGSMSSGK